MPLVQAEVAPGEQTPAPEQADQADHVPLLQVRVWVPQLPQCWVVGPEQVQAPPAHVLPLGQALPQLPQFAALVCVLTQVPAQQVSPVGHVVPHDPQLLESIWRFLQPRGAAKSAGGPTVGRRACGALTPVRYAKAREPAGKWKRADFASFEADAVCGLNSRGVIGWPRALSSGFTVAVRLIVSVRGVEAVLGCESR